jgi:MoaA/NifB/PqqE/SkfB family radical SAM enzyme
MANLAITTVCNQHCAYCFTVDHLGDDLRSDGSSGEQAGEVFLSMDDFASRLDFLHRSGIEQVRLLGGEPTLHPQFVDLIELVRMQGMQVVVFTNGLVPESVLDCLASLSPDQCTVMVNVNQPNGTDSAGYHRRRLDTVRQLGQRALLGFNIYRLGFQLDFLIEFVTEAGCKPAIRLGMAHPCLSGENQYVHPNQYRAIARKIVQFARVAANSGVSLDFDCGFVRCMFSDADLDTLRAGGTKVGWRCNPILDIDLNGDVIHCFPLSRLVRLPLVPDSDAASMRGAFEERTAPYRQAGVFKECSTCHFKAAGECPGGCLATTMRRFRHTPLAVEMPREVTA